jgi:hypothetical protein
VRVSRPLEGRNYGTCLTVVTSHKLSSKINVMISRINQSPGIRKETLINTTIHQATPPPPPKGVDPVSVANTPRFIIRHLRKQK